MTTLMIWSVNKGLFLGKPSNLFSSKVEPMPSTTEVLIIGGGLIGLATAVEFAQQGVEVTVITRRLCEAATQSAAGMLAPQAERLSSGPLLELCLRSRSLYTDWVQKLENLTGLDAQYWPCGILAPLYEADLIDQNSEPQFILGAEHQWLDYTSITKQQLGLSSDVKGGWWFPADAQVDNQALAKVLYAAAQNLGVTILEGINVNTIQHHGNRICQVSTPTANWQAEVYILATGAWSGDLLPIPIRPCKGQMLSVQAASTRNEEQPLRQVLFGTEVYLIPRRNGRILIGATNEDVGFQSHNTPLGIQTLLAAAIRLFPQIQHMILEKFWSGFRPTTSDKEPIIGTSPYENLFLATGHHRNGILLAPITAKMMANLILSGKSDPLLDCFNCQRFGYDWQASF